ncbi:hypothetical protein Daura_20375 [Dactylosporangium aurantiacum]|uniref:Uncharacterized protein n=1 Tax=Dactylosporangium aurantiacum TaxID=35754 RepID=A0A9Q9IMM3_9ACTN|nr:hypothetical protein [Dactylosporangium aurantiacum]MDG6106176.1 hypothetical protein [Dactylosporangium aurantiacum]UWZ58321.1 hypothetical protein Daura_20375 [Dactylosporangium aurantiacum]
MTNLSNKRVLHVVDTGGIAAPLPVARTGWPVSRRALDQPTMTILVAGEAWTYAVSVEGPPADAGTSTPAPVDPVSTRDVVLHLTDNRREVLVALARGYLRPYPHYDPKPRGYDDVAAQLRLTRTQVTRRVEDIREILVDAGVEGLDSGRDGRRALCEWLLSMRLVTVADLDWLAARIQQRDAGAAAPTAAGGLSPTQFARLPSTRVTRAAYAAARTLAPALTARLADAYGPDWLDKVNVSRRSHGLQPATSLEDYRVCLAVLARDPATAGWAPEPVRAAAAALKTLADQAAHGRADTDAAAGEAKRLSVALAGWAPPAARPPAR